MDILAGRERLLELGHVGHVRRQPQLDLRIIRGEQHIARLGHEGFADLPPDLGADGDVLEVGIGRGQPARLRAHQAVTGVHTAGVRIDRGLERIGVSRLELGKLAPFEHLGRDLRALCREPFEDRLVGRILPALPLAPPFVAKLVEQNVTKLLGAADGELEADRVPDLPLDPCDLAREFLAQAGQPPLVHLDAVALHTGDHGDEGAVDALVNLRAALLCQSRLEMPVEPPSHIGILGGVLRRLVQRHLTEGNRLLAGAADVLEAQGIVPEVACAELVHAVAAADPFQAAPGIEREADDHGVVDRRNPDVGASGKDIEIIFDVLPQLEHLRRFEQLAQRGVGRLPFHLRRLLGEHVAATVSERDVTGVIGPQRQADTREFRPHGIEAAGFGIHGDHAGCETPRDPVLQAIERLHAFIGGAIDRRHRGQRLAVAPCCRWRAGRLRCRGMERGGARRAAASPIEALEKAGEAVVREERGQRLRGDTG